MPRTIQSTFRLTHRDRVPVDPDQDAFALIKEFDCPGLLFPWRDDLGRVWICHLHALNVPSFREEVNQRLPQTFPEIGESVVRAMSADQLHHYIIGMFCAGDVHRLQLA